MTEAARLKKVRPRISPRPDLTGAWGTSARAAIGYNIVGAGPAVEKNRRSLIEQLKFWPVDQSAATIFTVAPSRDHATKLAS